jgi:protein SCO1/2
MTTGAIAIVSHHRRWLLKSAAAGGVGLLWPALTVAHSSIGPVDPPQRAPEMTFRGADGNAFELRRRLTGCVTALQLMFTGCSATCPIQGAIFADAMTGLLKAAGHLRLLSVSVDPLSDDPKALRAWLARFDAAPGRWTAASPNVQDQNRLPDFLRGRDSGADRHATQVFLFDKKAQLVFRTTELPSGAHLAELMLDLDRRR